jgi:hypothetical protein
MEIRGSTGNQSSVNMASRGGRYQGGNRGGGRSGGNRGGYNRGKGGRGDERRRVPFQPGVFCKWVYKIGIWCHVLKVETSLAANGFTKLRGVQMG